MQEVAMLIPGPASTDHFTTTGLLLAHARRGSTSKPLRRERDRRQQRWAGRRRREHDPMTRTMIRPRRPRHAVDAQRPTLTV